MKEAHISKIRQGQYILAQGLYDQEPFSIVFLVSCIRFQEATFYPKAIKLREITAPTTASYGFKIGWTSIHSNGTCSLLSTGALYENVEYFLLTKKEAELFKLLNSTS